MTTVVERLIPFSRPSIGEEEVRAVAEVLRSGWLTAGPKVREFERQFAHAVQRQHAIAVHSCTSALFMCLQALELPPGSKVAIPALTWPSAVAAAMLLQLIPVLVDVDWRTLNLDPRSLRTVCDASVRALIPVHFAGLPYAVEEITTVAKEHGLAIIDDCAHALGTRVEGKPVGAHATAACYSFHPIKNMTTGEGGMIVTDREELAQHLRALRLLGVTRDAWSRYSTSRQAGYDVTALSLKHNMTDLQAALGIVQLGKIEQFNARRRKLALRYLEALSGLKGLLLPEPGDMSRLHAWHLFTVRTEDESGPYGRDAVVDALSRQGIATGLHFIAIPDLTYFQAALRLDAARTPNAVRAGRTIFSLPLYPGLSDDDQATVITALRSIFTG